jgi:hypothetical protein
MVRSTQVVFHWLISGRNREGGHFDQLILVTNMVKAVETVSPMIVVDTFGLEKSKSKSSQIDGGEPVLKSFEFQLAMTLRQAPRL